MKKILVVFAILSTIVLASCGGSGVKEEGADSVAVDSTEVVVDTVAVEVVDSVEVEAQVEAVK